MSQGELVFVYGTLRTGDCRHGVGSLLEVVHEAAFLSSHRMLHLGGFPGIIPDKDYEGKVRGEVHLYEDFRLLDSIEGFHKGDERNCLYLRRQVLVEIPGKEEPLEVSTYIFNRASHRSQEEIEKATITTGDWFNQRVAGQS